jgi:hypothetical protein
LTGQEAQTVYSGALLEAQQRLFALRERQRLIKNATNRREASGQIDPLPEPIHRNQDRVYQNNHHIQTAHTSTPSCAKLPRHLGWGTERLTAVLRKASIARRQKAQHGPQQTLGWIKALQCDFCPTPPSQGMQQPAITEDIQSVKLHPTIAMGMLRNKLAASGRIWLLLRALDRTGRGWIEVAEARQLLCDRQSAAKVCGWRQLRNLIAQGQGIYWERRDDRLWLRSVPKVTQALGVKRLSGHPVALPVALLTQGIGQVRAHLFASFHSGRKKSMPIARATLATISQVSPRTQREYDRLAQVQSQKNFAIGPSINTPQAQEIAWQQGQASFSWRDHNGKFTKPDQTILAWQLPNSYTGPHQQRPRGRQKQFNRKLADLFTIGKTGNDQSPVEMKPKRYFNAAKSASLAQARSGTAVYWQGGRSGSWYYMDTLQES